MEYIDDPRVIGAENHGFGAVGQVFGHCECCGEVIYIGEEYYLSDDGQKFCLSCVSIREAC